jgi:thiamine biosynthesis lipoprotein ApbE
LIGLDGGSSARALRSNRLTEACNVSHLGGNLTFAIQFGSATFMLSFTQQFFALGSDCTLQIYAANEAHARNAAAAAMAEIGRIEARYSRYRADSEISRINSAAVVGGTVDVDAETAGLLTYARACFDKSGGVFDITAGLLRHAWNFSSGRLPEREYRLQRYCPVSV